MQFSSAAEEQGQAGRHYGRHLLKGEAGAGLLHLFHARHVSKFRKL